MSATAPYAVHVFTCTNDFACLHDGAAKGVHATFKRLARAEGRGDVRANQSGCLNQCGHGPMVVVYPQGVWYAHVDEASAQRIWGEHIVSGKPVEELRYHPPKPGKNKLIRLGAGPGSRPDPQDPGFLACPRCPPS